MKSLSELADIYDRWATANEATAEELRACMESLPKEVQEQPRWHAGQLVAVNSPLAGETRPNLFAGRLRA